jgi:CheY-like chemotaxis protein
MDAAERSPLPARGARMRRILIVDDHAESADALAEYLDHVGHGVRACYHPVEALRVASLFAPDLVLLDLELPGMDGWELGTRLREQAGSQSLQLVAVSGHEQEQDRERSRVARFDSHLVKPVDVNHVQQVIEALSRDHRKFYKAGAVGPA